MSVIAVDLRGLPKDRASLAVRYASGLGTQLSENLHELIIVYRYAYQLDLVPDLAKVGRPLRVSTNISFINNRVLNRAGVELLYSPTLRFNRIAANFRVITTDLSGFAGTQTRRPIAKVSADRVITGSVAASKRLVERKQVTAQPTTIHPSTNLQSTDRNLRIEPVEKVILYSGPWIYDQRAQYLAEALGVLGDFELVVTPKLSESEIRRVEKLFQQHSARVRFAQLSSTNGLRDLISNSFAVLQTEVPDPHGLIPADVFAFGIPSVLIDDPIMQELAGTTGTFSDPKDPLSLASKIRGLQRHGAWMRASDTAKKKSEQLTWAISSQKLERLIQQLLS